jgi:hypothetical protein
MRRWTTMAGLAVLPAFLSGCGALGLSSSPEPEASTPEPGSNWLLLAEGDTAPSPSTGYPAGAAAPTATSGAGLATTTPTPTATASATCSDDGVTFGPISGATVVASATSAKVTWHSTGGTDLLRYRVTAISQNLVTGHQRDIGYTALTPTKNCGPISATITGLDPKTEYVFSVDAVVRRESGSGTRAATVARSSVTSTT